MQLSDFPLYRQEGCVTGTTAAASGSGSGDSGLSALPYFEFTIAFSVAVFLLERILDRRQIASFRSAKALPKDLKGAIPEEKFTQSLSYGGDKLSFAYKENVIMFIEGMALLLLGWLPYAWDLSADLASRYGIVSEGTSDIMREIYITCIFVGLLTIHDTIVSLPFNLYSTFVVEEKHGFNKTTIGLFFRDKALSLVLTMGLGCPILAVVVKVVRHGGPHFYFYVWAFLCATSIVLMTVYPTWIAPLFNKYTPLQEGELYDKISALAKRVDFPLTKLYVVDGSKRSAHSNAYFYGFMKNKRIVLYDTLMNQVEQTELLAILGHEIGHWKLWHTVQGFVISQLYIFSLFLTFSTVQHTPALFEAFGFKYVADAAGNNNMPVLIGLVLFSQTFWGPVDKVLSLVMNFNSRRNEFQADKFSCDLGYGEELAQGLIKISIENLGNMVPDAWYSLYHFSHPPLVERLGAIRKNTAAAPDRKSK